LKFAYNQIYILEQKPIDLMQGKPVIGKVGVYYINLERSQERNQKMIEQLGSFAYPVKRVPGVDGKLLSIQTINQLVDYKTFEIVKGVPAVLGEIGCYLSHLKCWQEFYESDNEYAVILEDDALFDCRELETSIKELLKRSNDWDICRFDYTGKPMQPFTVVLDNKYSIGKFSSCSWGTAGYILNKKTAEKYLHFALPIKMPVDHFFIRCWEFDIKLRGLYPQILKQSNLYMTISGTNGLSHNDNHNLKFHEQYIKLRHYFYNKCMRYGYKLGYKFY